MSNEITFPSDLPVADKLNDNDKLLLAHPSGELAAVSGRAINAVQPLESADDIAAIRIQTPIGTQHSATVRQLATALASQSVLAGPVGPKGDKGDTGAAGPVGATGPQGIAGKDAGMDYSKLEEQLVPGEFAYNKSQQRSQVYVRSFIATASDSTYTQLPLTIPDSGCVIAAWGSVLAGTVSAYPISVASIHRYTSGSNSYGLLHKYSFIVDAIKSTIPAGATVYITIKYVK